MAVTISLRITPSKSSQADSRLLVNGQITFPIESFTLGAENAVNIGSVSGGAGAGKVKLEPISITKTTGPESSFLYTALCMGTHLQEVSLEMVPAGSDKPSKTRQPFYLIKLRTVMVSSFQVSAHADIPQEMWTLAYGAIQTAYHPTDKTGKLDKPFISSWDQTTNTSKFEP